MNNKEMLQEAWITAMVAEMVAGVAWIGEAQIDCESELALHFATLIDTAANLIVMIEEDMAEL